MKEASIIIKTPRVVYDEHKIQACPICGEEKLTVSRYSDGAPSYGEENGIADLYFVMCPHCGLQCGLNYWNKLAKKEN